MERAYQLTIHLPSSPNAHLCQAKEILNVHRSFDRFCHHRAEYRESLLHQNYLQQISKPQSQGYHHQNLSLEYSPETQLDL